MENEDFKRVLVDPYSEKEDNDAFFNRYLSKEFSLKEKHSSNKDK